MMYAVADNRSQAKKYINDDDPWGRYNGMATNETAFMN
jgi:hypothetical protein